MSLLKEIHEIKSTQKELKSFAWVMAGAFLVIGLLLWFKGHGIATYFFYCSAFFLIFGLFCPQALKPIQKIWMTLALCMGAVMSRVILILMYYLLITPIGLAMRLSGRDPLSLKHPGQTLSYWMDHTHKPTESYENQF